MGLLYRQASVLQFQESTFTILGESLLTLQPGAWLNSEIVVGALRLLQEVSNIEVQVVDSLTQTTTGIDFLNTKVLLPMLIHGDHWVLGVYKDSEGLLVYDSNPKGTTATEARRVLAEILQEDDRDIQVTITSPLLQTNDDDCGVFAIIAAFHEMMGFAINPLEIDPDFWRDILLRLLSPQPYPAETQKTQVNLPGLSGNTRLSEFSGISRRHLNANRKKVASAQLVLQIAEYVEQNTRDTDPTDVTARFQHLEDHCKNVIQPFQKLEECIAGLMAVRITD